MRIIFASLFLVIYLSSCATQVHKVGSSGGTLKQDKIQLFFLQGIGQTRTVDAAAVCGGASRVARTANKYNFLDIVINSFTFGIISPRHSMVYCK